MHFNSIVTLLAALSFTLTGATVEQADKRKLAAAHPVRGAVAKSGKLANWGSNIKSFLSKPRRSAPSSLQTSSSSDSSKACARQLEGILYQPETNVKAYMAKIALEIRADIQVIMAAFSAGNLEYIRTYIQKYNILITIMGPFGAPVLITENFVAYTSSMMSVGLAQTYLNREGFYVDSTNGFYIYQFVLWSNDGQMISFILGLPTSAMANTPIDCSR